MQNLRCKNEGHKNKPIKLASGRHGWFHIWNEKLPEEPPETPRTFEDAEPEMRELGYLE